MQHSVEELVAAERRLLPWSELAWTGFVLLAGLGPVIARSERTWFHQLFDAVRFPTGGHVTALPTIPATATAAIWVSLLVGAAIYAMLLPWQFRAATTAVRLGLPARLVPGLGVGGWFIPIVSLWFPYWALRDCLPPAHPGRAGVGRLWACFVGHLVFNTVATVLVFVGTPVAWLFIATNIAFAAGVAWTGSGAVRTISGVHGDLAVAARGPDGPI